MTAAVASSPAAPAEAADTRRIALPDGRALGLATLGEPSGAPVVFLHGFPSSRHEGRLYHEAARAAGVCLLAPDRPGVGLSDPLPGRAVTDFPADVAGLLDALGIGTARILGASGGAPYALATAALRPERVAAVATVAGLGPPTERAAIDAMSPTARLAFALARRAPRAFRIGYGTLARVVARRPALAFRLGGTAPPDAAVLKRPHVHATMLAAIGEAFRQGPPAAVEELSLVARPWGFCLSEVSRPLTAWHGTADETVPVAMAAAIVDAVPGARRRTVEGEGHLSLPVRHGETILRALLAAG